MIFATLRSLASLTSPSRPPRAIRNVPTGLAGQSGGCTLPLRSKKAANRPKDQASLPILELTLNEKTKNATP